MRYILALLLTVVSIDAFAQAPGNIFPGPGATSGSTYSQQWGAVPYLGWNNWGSGTTPTWADVDFTKMNATVVTNLALTWLTNGMAGAGYNVICIDGGWEAWARDGNGNLTGNTNFPNMKGLCDWLHSLGYKVGHYLSRGTNQCGTTSFAQPGSYGHETNDAAIMGNYYKVDLIKLDSCPAGWASPREIAASTVYPDRVLWDAVFSAPNVTNAKPFLLETEYNISAWEPSVVNCWQDAGGDYIVAFTNLQRAIVSQTNGQWYYHPGSPFADMPQLIGPSHYKDTGVTSAVGPTNVVLASFCMLHAMLDNPLLLDFNPTNSVNLASLTNPEIIGVMQDPAVYRANWCVNYNTNNVQMWTKVIQNGNAKAVCFFNTSTNIQTVTAYLTDMGFVGNVAIRDILLHTNIGAFSTSFQTVVPAQSVTMYIGTVQTPKVVQSTPSSPVIGDIVVGNVESQGSTAGLKLDSRDNNQTYTGFDIFSISNWLGLFQKGIYFDGTGTNYVPIVAISNVSGAVTISPNTNYWYNVTLTGMKLGNSGGGGNGIYQPDYSIDMAYGVVTGAQASVVYNDRAGGAYQWYHYTTNNAFWLANLYHPVNYALGLTNDAGGNLHLELGDPAVYTGQNTIGLLSQPRYYGNAIGLTNHAGAINVNDLGADPSGVLDSTAAFWAAVSNTVHASVFVPHGKYLINQSILLPQGTRIFGEGDKNSFENSVSCLFSPTNANVILVPEINCRISDLLFQGDPNNSTNQGCAATGIQGLMIGGSIERCSFNRLATGLMLTNSFNVDMSSLYFLLDSNPIVITASFYPVQINIRGGVVQSCWNAPILTNVSCSEMSMSIVKNTNAMIVFGGRGLTLQNWDDENFQNSGYDLFIDQTSGTTIREGYFGYNPTNIILRNVSGFAIERSRFGGTNSIAFQSGNCQGHVSDCLFDGSPSSNSLWTNQIVEVVNSAPVDDFVSTSGVRTGTFGGDGSRLTNNAVNVQSLGADPTGVASSWAAFQTAITNSAHAAIFVPHGQYLIDSSLILPQGTEITGEGDRNINQNSCSMLFNPSNGVPILVITNNCRLRNLLFQGNAYSNQLSIASGVVGTIGEGSIENCTFNRLSCGLWLTNSFSVDILNCYSLLCSNAYVVTSSSSYPRINFIGGEVDSCINPLSLTNVSSGTVMMSFLNNTNPIYISGGSGLNFQSLDVNNNANGSVDFYAYNTTGLRISGSHFAYDPTNIVLNHCTTFSVDSCRMGGTNSISLDAACNGMIAGIYYDLSSLSSSNAWLTNATMEIIGGSVSKRFDTVGGNQTNSGVVSASQFVGDGRYLSNISGLSANSGAAFATLSISQSTSNRYYSLSAQDNSTVVDTAVDILPVTQTLTNFWMHNGTALSAGTNCTITLVTNGVDAMQLFNVTGTAAGVVLSNYTNITLSQGLRVGWRLGFNGTGFNPRFHLSWQNK